MARSTRHAIFTEKIFGLEEAIEKGKKEFLEYYRENALMLRNLCCGDSYLSQFLTKMLHKALEKYMFE